MKRDTLDNNSIIDLDLHLSRLPQKEIVTEIKRPVLQPIHMDWDNILTEWSYRLPKGYPTIENGIITDEQELAVLREILQEHGVSEIPTLTISKPKTIVQEAEQEEAITKDMLLKAIEKLNPDQMSSRSIQKLYQTIQAFSTFKPLRAALKSKGYQVQPDVVSKTTGQVTTLGFDMPKFVASSLQQMLTNFSPKEYEALIAYIDPTEREKRGLKPLVFGSESRWGKLTDELPDNLKGPVTQAFAKYTGQDEKKRGVGMGEILMALLFDNISKPKGKGDLQINGKEFEVKGAGAILGGVSSVPTNVANQYLDYVDIQVAQGGGFEYKLRDKKSGRVRAINNFSRKNQLTDVLSAASKDYPSMVTTTIQKLLVASGIDEDDALTAINLINDWKSAMPHQINMVFGLANFMRYAKKEKFGAFIAMDYGQKGDNAGIYFFTQGTPEEMAEAIFSSNVGFEPATLGDIWPRMNATGGPRTTPAKA